MAAPDCRLTEAAIGLNAQLRARGLNPLSRHLLLMLYSRSDFPVLLAGLAERYGLAVDEARALLQQWHAWNTTRSRP